MYDATITRNRKNKGKKKLRIQHDKFKQGQVHFKILVVIRVMSKRRPRLRKAEFRSGKSCEHHLKRVIEA